MRYGIFCLLATLTLCASSVSAVAATATIGSIKVAPGGSRIEIQGDQPLTYIYRRMADGSGILLDVAPGKTRGMTGELPGAGPVTGIWVRELQVEGIPVTRFVIGTEKEMAVNVARDPADPGRLLVTFPSLASAAAPVPGDPHLTELLEQGGHAAPKSPPEDTTPAGKNRASAASPSSPAREMAATLESEIKPVPAAPPAVQPPPPASGPAQVVRPVVTSVSVAENTVEIVTGSGATRYDSFRLNGPERLVLDLPGATASLPAREVRIGRFGVAKARIGVYDDKVRVVFDAASKEGIPLSVIQKTARGIKVTFAATRAGR